MTRLADFTIHTLTDLGISQAFLVTGGAAMHLNDALAGEKRIRVVCHHHEPVSYTHLNQNRADGYLPKTRD